MTVTHATPAPVISPPGLNKSAELRVKTLAAKADSNLNLITGAHRMERELTSISWPLTTT